MKSKVNTRTVSYVLDFLLNRLEHFESQHEVVKVLAAGLEVSNFTYVAEKLMAEWDALPTTNSKLYIACLRPEMGDATIRGWVMKTLNKHVS